MKIEAAAVLIATIQVLTLRKSKNIKYSKYKTYNYKI
jgi:hypothetical protein